MKNKRADQFDIEANVLEQDISYRGRQLKVDVSSLFPEVENAVMGAYQNYLGGGMPGAIQSGAMFNAALLNKKDQATYRALAERIKRYFYELNNGGGDEYVQENLTGSEAPGDGYLKNQNLPRSAY